MCLQMAKAGHAVSVESKGIIICVPCFPRGKRKNMSMVMRYGFLRLDPILSRSPRFVRRNVICEDLVHYPRICRHRRQCQCQVLYLPHCLKFLCPRQVKRHRRCSHLFRSKVLCLHHCLKFPCQAVNLSRTCYCNR